MTPPNLGALLPSVCVGGAVLGLVLTRSHRRRAPGARMSLYVQQAAAGSEARPPANGNAAFASEAVRRVVGPLAVGLMAAGARSLGFHAGADIEMLMRQAGMESDLETYRREHLRWTVMTPLALGAVGLLTGSALLVVLFFLAGCVSGPRRARERLRAKVRRRREELRGDLPTVMAVLAIKIDNNKSLLVAIGEVVAEGSGPVVHDLARALNLVNSGFGDAAAFELVARESAEPVASRFFRLLATATGGGLDVAAGLLDQASELRVQRREEVERTSARRQMALVLPNLVFMAPVLFMFLLAPLPQVIFGTR